MLRHRVLSADVHFNDGSNQFNFPLATVAFVGLLFRVRLVANPEKNPAPAVLDG